MKKVLLLATMLLAGSSAFAGIDPASYENKGGYTMKNLWLTSRFVNEAEFQALPTSEFADRTRTVALMGDKIYVTVTRKNMPDGSTADQSSLVEYDLYTGTFLRKMDLTLDGAPFEGLLCANQVVADNFGHLCVGGYLASTYAEASETSPAHANPLKVYTIDLNTGALTLAAALALPDDEYTAEVAGRIDYFDVCGDITGAEAPCTVMAALASPCPTTTVYGWALEQGGSEWGPKMSGGEYVSATMSETFPAEQTSWGTAPTVRILIDEEYSGELFYVDGFTTFPALYNTEGSLIESFANVPADNHPKAGTNGVGEFSINGENFVIYSLGQYDAPNSCQINVCKLGENSSFDGLEVLYTLPEAGLGQTSDAGTRYHGIATRVMQDKNGKEACYIVTFKCNNGIGVYQFAQEGYESGINDVIVDENAPVEYFNLQGVRVANPENGLYIRRQGEKAEKVVL